MITANKKLHHAANNARSKGIYLLPNLFTTAGLFAGFYAIISAMHGSFDYAAIAILIATIADGLDGRVARLTGTESNFGSNYDSMADMVSFGVAPGLIIYEWSLIYLGKLGWLIAFWYTAATALRLSRFNTQAQLHLPELKQYSQGLTCTAAAATMASGLWLSTSYKISGNNLAISTAILTTIIAFLMISNCRYYLFKELTQRGRVPFINVVLAVVGIIAVALDPPEILCAMLICYVASGPLINYWQIKKVKNKKIDRLI